MTFSDETNEARPNGIQSLFTLKTVMLMAALTAVVSLAVMEPIVTVDSNSYMGEWHFFRQGQISLVRTPVYPALLALCSLAGDMPTVIWTVAILQWLLFIAVMPLVWDTLRMLGCGRIIRTILIVSLVTLCEELWIFNNALNTESLSITCLFAFIWCLTSLTCRPRMKVMVFAIILTALLVFLRPALVYLLPVCLLFFCIKAFGKKERKIWATGIGGMIVTSALYLAYCGAVYRQTGVFTPTVVSVFNSWCSARGTGMIDPDVIPDDEAGIRLKEMMRENDKTFVPDMTNEMSFAASIEYNTYRFSYGGENIDRMHRIITDSRKAHPLKYVKAVFSRFKAAFIQIFGQFNLGFGYTFLFLFLVVTVYFWVRRRRMPWLMLFIWTLAASHMVIPLINAMNSWDRLSLPAWTFFIAMIGCCASWVKWEGLKME